MYNLKELKGMSKMIDTKQTIESPIFPGFYETIISEGYSDQDSEVEYLKEQGSIPSDIDISNVDFTYDYDSYKRDISIAYTDALAEHLEDHDLAYNVEFESIISPKYYNYSTDRLFIDLEVNMPRINQVIDENAEAFTKYLQDNYTSYDGYISFIENKPSLFADKLAALEPEYISVALRFCLEVLHSGHDSIDYELSISAIEDVSLCNYIESIEYLQDGHWVKVNH